VSCDLAGALTNRTLCAASKRHGGSSSCSTTDRAAAQPTKTTHLLDKRNFDGPIVLPAPGAKGKVGTADSDAIDGLVEVLTACNTGALGR